MSRPCECGNAIVGDYTPDQCMPCWRVENSEWWRERYATGKAPRPKPAPVRLPCVHVGDRLTVAEIRAAGINPRLSWHRCELGVTAPGAPPGVTCSCRGCGPRCEQYEPDDRESGAEIPHLTDFPTRAEFPK